jgi:hypothetical protein
MRSPFPPGGTSELFSRDAHNGFPYLWRPFSRVHVDYYQKLYLIIFVVTESNWLTEHRINPIAIVVGGLPSLLYGILLLDARITLDEFPDDQLLSKIRFRSLKR